MEESVLYSFEAEYGVVGAMLLDPELIDLIGAALDPSDFYDEDSADLFALIVSCRMSGIKPDVIVLSERMPTLPSGEQTLSVAANIVRNTPSAANAMHYAGIVKERAVKRSLRAVGESIAAMALSGESLEAILAAAQSAVLSVGATESGQEFAPVGEYVNALIDHIDESFNSDGEFRGLRTGLNDLDDILLGMRGGHMVVIGGRPGTGKAQPLSAKVLRSDGVFTTMGEVKVGDRLASVDGLESVVVGVYPQGIRPIYRVTMTDGRTVEADAEHLWTIESSKWESERTVTTLELQRLLTVVRYTNRITFVSHTGNFGAATDLGIDPWAVGFLLGDGGLTTGVRFSTPEPYILERIEAATGIVPKHIAAYDYRLSTERGQPNPVLDALRALGIMGKASHEKSVPAAVFTADRKTRQGVLAGLLESDGWVDKSGSVMFASSSEKLRDDVAALVESLGGSCRKRIKTGCGYTIDGKRTACRDSHMVCLGLDCLPDFIRSPRLLKNLRLVRRCSQQPYVGSVEFVRDDQAVCIKVSHPSELYLTDRWLVTHNTTLAMNIIESIADQQKVPALVFSLEMSAWELSRRMLCSLGRIPLKSIDTGSVLTTHSSNLAMAALKMKDIPVFVSDRAGMTMSRIRAVSRLAKRQHDIGVIAIDYLGLVQPERTNSNHSVTVAEISRQCKLLAKELDIPVVVLCQLNRSIESRADKTPMLSDLRDSGAIEQDADMIVFTHKDDHPEAQGLTRLVVAKHRHGAPGECRVVHRGDLSRFETLAPGSYHDY